MTRRALLATLCLALVPAGLRAQAARPSAGPSAAAPRLAIEPESFDFGTLLPGKTLHKEFVIRNHGGADLVIEGVSTSCGCTAALPEQRRVKPGASTPLRVTFETRNYSGRIERIVLVRSNDPARGLFELRLRASVSGGEPPAR